MAGNARFRRSAAGSPRDLVPAAVEAERQYEADAAEVTRVLVRVERGDGTAREYEAAPPLRCEVSTGMAGTGSQAFPTLSLWLTASPRHSLHIRTHGPWARCPGCEGARGRAGLVLPRDGGADDGPAVTHLGVFMGYENGASRELTLAQPAECVLVHLNEDAAPGAEPRLALIFAGNPAAGGVQVNQEGKVT